MNVTVRKRCRQHARQKQSEIDGRRDCGQAEAARMAKPPFIEPALLRAGFDMSGDAPVWFRVWNLKRNLAIAIDVTSDEVEPSGVTTGPAAGRHDRGHNYAGPFPSQRQARDFAVERLAAAR